MLVPSRLGQVLIIAYIGVSHMQDPTPLLAAKSDPEDTSLWLPLWMHLKDSAGVMRKLVHQWIPQSVIRASGLSYTDFRKTAVFVAAVHDIGKATSYFQSLITRSQGERRAELSDAGFTLKTGFTSTGKTPHSYAGQWILQSGLPDFPVSPSIANVVGAHHGTPIDLPKKNLLAIYETNFYGTEDDTGKKVWITSWRRFLMNALSEAHLGSVEDLPDLTAEAQVLLSGLLIVADWLASNTRYFPLISADSLGDVNLYPARINRGYDRVSFPEGWRPETLFMDDTLFRERFQFPPNQVQQSVMTAVQSCRNPGIFILEAPMGIGKTEAALAAAELLASEKGASGIFFGLPTQATSNGIFPRLYDWAEQVSEETAASIRLAHAAAELNEEYAALLEEGHAYVDAVESDTEDTAHTVSVHPWFQGSKKALLSDFVIGTVDQFLMASLKRRHFMLRHLALTGKVVIIDECHAYDAYMNLYLEQSLSWMGAYGIPVILLSATLPAQKCRDLTQSYLSAYAEHFLKKPKLQKPQFHELWEDIPSYPRLTWTEGTQVHREMIPQDSREMGITLEKSDSLDTVLSLLRDSLREGGCACIIMNTVKAAQEIFQAIEGAIPDAEALLYHAQFTMPDRSAKEQKLIRHMGKKSTAEDRNKFILIGTQVLEQSLDYDADIIITQLCPMDLLLQRLGRLHRHPRSRPAPLRDPRCILYVNDESLSHPGRNVYDDGSKSVYAEYLLARTWELLVGKARIRLPAEIPPLIEAVYREDPPLEEGGKMQNLYEDFLDRKKEKEQRAKHYRLSIPARNSIAKILENSEDSSESIAERSVRDGASSLEVLLLRRTSSGFMTDASGHAPSRQLDSSRLLTEEEGRFIARQRLRLPGIFSSSWNISQAIRELEDRNRAELSLWQQSPWVKGELVLLFDEHSTASLCGYQLTYTTETGLTYRKLEDGNGQQRI